MSVYQFSNVARGFELTARIISHTTKPNKISARSIRRAFLFREGITVVFVSTNEGLDKTIFKASRIAATKLAMNSISEGSFSHEYG